MDTGSGIDVVRGITGRATENVTNGEADNETGTDNGAETEECAASISVSFNQDVYNKGDLFELTISVFDSQGNPLSNYDFYTTMYDNMWHTPGLQETGADGSFKYTMTAEKPAGGVTKVKFKAYTKESGSCGVVEDIGEIGFIYEEEPGSESPPSTGSEPVPTVCAAKIDVIFDKEVYYIGDTAKIVIEVLDSQGNHLPNYVFYNQMYDGIWHTPGSERTDNKGHFKTTPTVEKEQSKIGKIKFKVYTKASGSCGAVEDIEDIEIREKESIPVPCGIGTCIPEEEAEEEPIEIPEDKVFYKCNGCELGEKCYPLGYRKEGQFCSEDYEFVGQSKAGICDNDFECESNVCISSECVEEGLMRRIIKWFRNLFGGEPKPPKIKECSKLLIEKDIGDYEYFISEYGKREEQQVAVYSDDGEQIDIVKCCMAGYSEPDGEAKGTAGVVCPFDNRKDLENALYWLSNKEEIILGEYKGQEVYRAGNAIVWIHKDFLVAAGTDPKATIPAPEKIINAYLDKYPNDL
jgi:hypothetical protein